MEREETMKLKKERKESIMVLQEKPEQLSPRQSRKHLSETEVKSSPCLACSPERRPLLPAAFTGCFHMGQPCMGAGERWGQGQGHADKKTALHRGTAFRRGNTGHEATQIQGEAVEREA